MASQSIGEKNHKNKVEKRNSDGVAQKQKLSPLRIDELNAQINKSIGVLGRNCPSPGSKGSLNFEESSESNPRDDPGPKDMFMLRKRSSPWDTGPAFLSSKSKKSESCTKSGKPKRPHRSRQVDEEMPTGPAVHLFSLQSYLHCQIIPKLPQQLVVSADYSRYVFSRWLVLSNRLDWGMKYKPFKFGELPMPVGATKLKDWLLDYFKRNRAGNAKPVLIRGRPGIGKTSAIESICVSDGYLLEHVDCCLFKTVAEIKKKYHEALKSSSVRMTQKLSSPTAWNPDIAVTLNSDRIADIGQPTTVSRVFLIHNLHFLLLQEEDRISVLNIFKNGHFPVLIECSTSSPDLPPNVLKEVDTVVFDAPEHKPLGNLLIEVIRVEVLGWRLMMNSIHLKSRIQEEIEEASSSSSQDRTKDITIEQPDNFMQQNRISLSGSHNSLLSSNDPTPQFGVQFAPFLPGSPEANLPEVVCPASNPERFPDGDDEESELSFQAKPRRRNRDLYFSPSESDSDLKNNPDSTATNPKQDGENTNPANHSDLSDSHQSDFTGSDLTKPITPCCWRLPFLLYQTGTIMENQNYAEIVEKNLATLTQNLTKDLLEVEVPFTANQIINLLENYETNLHSVYQHLKAITLQLMASSGGATLGLLTDLRSFSSPVYFNHRPLMPTGARSWKLGSGAASNSELLPFQHLRLPISADMLLSVPGLLSSNQMIDISELVSASSNSPNKDSSKRIHNQGFPIQLALNLGRLLGFGRHSSQERAFGSMNLASRELLDNPALLNIESPNHNKLSNYWSQQNENQAATVASKEWRRLTSVKGDDKEYFRRVFLNQCLLVPKQNAEAYLTEKAAVDRIIFEDYLTQKLACEAKRRGAVRIKEPEFFCFLNSVKGLAGRSGLSRFLGLEYSPDALRFVDERLNLYNKVMDAHSGIEEIRKSQKPNQINFPPKQVSLSNMIHGVPKNDSFASYEAKMASNPWLAAYMTSGPTQPISAPSKQAKTIGAEQHSAVKVVDTPPKWDYFKSDTLERLPSKLAPISKASSIPNFFTPTTSVNVKEENCSNKKSESLEKGGKNRFNRRALVYQNSEDEEPDPRANQISSTQLKKDQEILSGHQEQKMKTQKKSPANISGLERLPRPDSKTHSIQDSAVHSSDCLSAKKKSIFQSEEEDSIGLNPVKQVRESPQRKSATSTQSRGFKIQIHDESDSEHSKSRDPSNSEEAPGKSASTTQHLRSGVVAASKSQQSAVVFSSKPKKHAKDLIKVYEIDSSPLVEEKPIQPTILAGASTAKPSVTRLPISKKPTPFRETDSQTESVSEPRGEQRGRKEVNHEVETSGLSEARKQSKELVRQYSAMYLVGGKEGGRERGSESVSKERGEQASSPAPEFIEILNQKLGQIDKGKRARRHSNLRKY